MNRLTVTLFDIILLEMNIKMLPKYELRTQYSAISSPLVGKNVYYELFWSPS